MNLWYRFDIDKMEMEKEELPFGEIPKGLGWALGPMKALRLARSRISAEHQKVYGELRAVEEDLRRELAAQ